MLIVLKNQCCKNRTSFYIYLIQLKNNNKSSPKCGVIDSNVSWPCLGISWGLTLCSEWLCGLGGFHLHLIFTAGFCLDLLFLCGPSSIERQGHDGSQMLPGS